MCCSLRFRVRATECSGKLSVRDRSRAPQPILRWGTICFELCAGFEHPVVLHKCGFCVFFFNLSLPLIAGCDKRKKYIYISPGANSLQQMHDKDTEGETKSICSCVFDAAWRSYLGSGRPHRGMSRGFKASWEKKMGGQCVSGNRHTGGSDNNMWSLFISGMSFQTTTSHLQRTGAWTCTRGTAGPKCLLNSTFNTRCSVPRLKKYTLIGAAFRFFTDSGA